MSHGAVTELRVFAYIDSLMSVEGGIPFGQYTLLRRVARGGMAEVFLAKQRGIEGFDRRVAVKRILPHLSDSREFVSMFLTEARLAARLAHPNIVHIYEFGKHGDDYFIAMEYIDGLDAGQLATLTAQVRMPWALLARIGADAATGLTYAHNITDDQGKKLGLVHRDVSPANVLVSRAGIVKLVDFGIAKAADTGDQRTSPGMVKGKFSYMSPEQTIGSKLDGRSDVFSLAIVLWEIAAGRTMISRGDPGAAMRALRDGTFQPIEKVRPDIPPQLAQAFTWALEIDRERRATAAEFATALEAYVKSAPELATAAQLGAWLSEHAQAQLAAVDESSLLPGVTPAAPKTSLGPSTAIAPATGAAEPLSRLDVRLAAAARTRAPTDDSELAATIAIPRFALMSAKRADTANGDTEPVVRADLAEELARTNVFAPSDPAELEATVERPRDLAALLPPRPRKASVPMPPPPVPAAGLTALPGIPPQPASPRPGPRKSSTYAPMATSVPTPAPLPPPPSLAPIVAPAATPANGFPQASMPTPVPTAAGQAAGALAIKPAAIEPRPPSLPRSRDILSPQPYATSVRHTPDDPGTMVVAALPEQKHVARPWLWLVPLILMSTAALTVWLLLRYHTGAARLPTQATHAADAMRVQVSDASAVDAEPRTQPNVDATTRTADAKETVPTVPTDVAVVEISTFPIDAQVTFDDRGGTAPARFECKGGKHVITAEAPGFARVERTIEAKLGQVARVQLTLAAVASPATGRVLLRSRPPTAVFEGGKHLGTTPLDMELSTGVHVLTFRAAGYRPESVKVTVKSDATKSVNATLKRNR